MKKIIEHYDALIDENNDPVHDPIPLKEYMDKWDGQKFIDCLCLLPYHDVLEIGVGTGRLAIKICESCNTFLGIDVSAKTIERAIENLNTFENCTLVCADFLEYQFNNYFDVIYSSLTFIHIADKKSAIAKTAGLLKPSGRFILSSSKSQDKFLEMNGRELELFPTSLEEIKLLFAEAGLDFEDSFETEFAFIVSGIKGNK